MKALTSAPSRALQDNEAQSPSVAETLADQLRARILDGDFAAGQRLIEADLIEEFSVGRGAVREALKQLESRGLVEIRRQRGASVVRLTREKIIQIFELRERLEGFGAYLAAERSQNADNRAWLEAQKRIWLDPALERNERDHMLQNLELHDGLVRMSGNPYLKESLDRLRIPAYRQRFVRVINDDVRRKSAQEHLDILDAVLAGEPERADAAMRLHVRETAKLAVSVGERS